MKLPTSACMKDVKSFTGQGLVAALAGLLLAVLPVPAAAQASGERDLIDLFEHFEEQELARTSEWALFAPQRNTMLQAGKASGAISPAVMARARLDWMEALERLDALPPELADRRAVRIVRSSYQRAYDLAVFSRGRVELGDARPYAIDHLAGAYVEFLDVMTGFAPHTPEEADYWLQRLEQVGGIIDAEMRSLAFDARQGAVPPPVILDLMRATAVRFAEAPAAEHPFLAGLDRGLAGMEVDADTAARLRLRGERIVETSLKPAFARMVEGIDALYPLAPAQPGLWAQPEGEALYAALLGFFASGPVTPDEINTLGVARVAEIEAELDLALKQIGMEEGSVGERLAALAAQPGQIYPDTEEGRAALLARMQGVLDRGGQAMEAILPGRGLPAVLVEPVPDTLAGATPSAFYRSPGARTGGTARMMVNIVDLADWPDFTLPTLAFHEGMPGHHADALIGPQDGLAGAVDDLVWIPAYVEGWATYAEDLADEAGLYADDPLGRIGYLQSLLLRAARCVVDTGLHDRRWTREEAIAYLVATTGLPERLMAEEVDRYIAWPGQSVTYLYGREAIREARWRARRVLGERFDEVAFNRVILEGGSRPIDVLLDDIEAWQARVIEGEAAAAR